MPRGGGRREGEKEEMVVRGGGGAAGGGDEDEDEDDEDDEEEDGVHVESVLQLCCRYCICGGPPSSERDTPPQAVGSRCRCSVSILRS